MKSTKFTPVDYFEHDLHFVLVKIEEQIREAQYKLFFIIADRQLLDVYAFKNFIEANEIKNFGRLKAMVKRAEQVIDLYNEHLYGGSELALKVYKSTSIASLNGAYLNIHHPFEFLTIEGIDTPSIATPAGYGDFLDKRPVQLSNYQFAFRCLRFIKAVDEFFGIRQVKNWKLNQSESEIFSEENIFIAHFIKGLHELQVQDNSQAFIAALKEGKTKDEHAFRNWFKTWFASKYQYVEAESQKGFGRIDLKVRCGEQIKVIEFKGWWNQDKIGVSSQLSSYLTDFEATGYIFIINHLKDKDITSDYKNYIMNLSDYENSWKTLRFENTDFCYYTSTHREGNRSKKLVHIIYRLFP